jgi:predicted GNAT family acetyltransferase
MYKILKTLLFKLDAQFVHETAPNDPPLTKERIIDTFKERPVFFWEVDGQPVSMAARNRETKDGSNISFVYTPPELRGRGYAGSVTAFACEDTFKDGKKVCFLYTDLRNPISNRIYQKIGFRPWCDSKNYVRV